MPNVKCVHGGYRYAFEGKRNWRSSSDERWETELGKVMCGKVVGQRRIDGSAVTVIRVRGKYYAALPHAFKKPGHRR